MELELAAQNPAVWGKPAEMQKINKEKSLLEKALQEWTVFKNRLDDAKTLLEMASEVDDESSFQEVKSELLEIDKMGQALELKRVLNSELDSNNTYLSINAGAGGTESCDWALMLLRMYIRYADKHGYKVEVLDRNDGDEAGIIS